MSGAKLTFTYQQLKGGAEATIGDGVNIVRMQVWNVTDALDDLLRCVVQLLKGYEAVWCVWEDDPGEHKWVFTRQHGAVTIHILRYPTSFSGYGAPEEWAETIFETTCPLLKFAGKVRIAVRLLDSEVGPEQYRRLSRHAFPQEHYDALRRLIQQRRHEASGDNGASA